MADTSNYFLDTYHPEKPQDTGNYFLDKYHKEEPKTEETKSFFDKLSQTWPAKVASEIYGGMKGSMEKVYSGQPVTSKELIPGAVQGASIAMTGAMPAAAGFVPAAKTLTNVGGNLINAARTSGVKYVPDAAIDAASYIKNALKPGTDAFTAEGTFDQIGKLAKMAESKQPIDFQDIHNIRLGLEDVQKNSARSTHKTAATDLQASTLAKHALDDWLENESVNHAVQGNAPEASAALREGNQNYAAGQAAEGLSKRQYRSELRASSANSGMNLGNTIKSNVTSMLLSPEARTLSPEARSQAELVVHGTRPENMLRYGGNLLGGGGGLGQALTGAGGAAGGFLLGGDLPSAGIGMAALPVFGSALKHGANELAVSHLGKLSEILRSQAPLSQSMNRTNVLAGQGQAGLALKQALIRALLANPPNMQPQ